MFSLSPRKFHSLLITPALLPLLIILITPKAAENHPPTAVDDSYVVHGNLVVPGPGITANDTDPDNDILHIGSCGTVAHGTLNCNTQYSFFTYEPNYGYVGADSFTYETCDGYGLCDTGTVISTYGILLRTLWTTTTPFMAICLSPDPTPCARTIRTLTAIRLALSLTRLPRMGHSAIHINTER